MTLQNPRLLAGIGLAGSTLLVGALIALAPWSSPNSNAEVLRQGDTNCDQLVDARDGLGALQVAADVQPTPPCGFAGDIDCSGGVDTRDAIAIVRYAAGLPAASLAAVQGECAAIGAPIGTTTPTTSPTPSAHSITPTPTKSPSPTPTHTQSVTPTVTPTVCIGPAGGAVLPPAPAATSAPSAMAYGAEQLISGTNLSSAANSAIQLALIPGRPTEAIIALQSGYLYRVSLDGSFSPILWGDVHTLVGFGGEQGLLSFAFSPNFQEDCRVYLYYTPGSPSPTVLSRFIASPTHLDEDSEEVLIRVEEFAANHNGATIIFDDNDYLYLSLGDGGFQDDPHERGQALYTLLGKVIRIDVSGASGYTIPPGNPYSGDKCSNDHSSGGTCAEIFAYGFRNPFRGSFDPVSGQIWVGDVGQSDWEEIDHVTAGGNYGWDCREGDHVHNDPAPAQGYTDLSCAGPFIAPRAEYNHDFDCPASNPVNCNQDVIGGVIYRGDGMPELYGYYIYADFASGKLWAVNTTDSSPPIRIGQLDINVSNFVLAANGEIYMLAYGSPYGPAGLYQLAHN